MTHQDGRICAGQSDHSDLLRESRSFHVAASDWLKQIREPKSPATPISNQLSVFRETERLAPDSGTFEALTCK